ncbi:hypothetical protein V2I28_07960 [Campylobacter sp. CX2-4080-23]|uniref:hypothetical protein n=1 Tax=Campylobacter porcelli TaxID=1660073 RepID=UPI002EBBCFF4|nr:hypothetical protein [Campylobacter sp. CX2-4080-23]
MEIYATAAEKFFKAGMRPRLKFEPTWSWWGLFGTVWFLFYRKLNMEGLIYLIACICLGWIPVINFLIGFYVPIFGKYLVIKRFEKALDMNNKMVFIRCLAWLNGLFM